MKNLKSTLNVSYRRPRYFIDIIQFVKKGVEVDFTINHGACHTELIGMGALTQFVTDEEMNTRSFNSNLSGHNVQVYSIIDKVTYVLENLYNVVESYLSAKKIGLDVVGNNPKMNGAIYNMINSPETPEGEKEELVREYKKITKKAEKELDKRAMIVYGTTNF